MLITEFSEFNNRSLVSFDFDGVLHSDVYPGTIHPIGFLDKIDWTPNIKMHKFLREESKKNDIIIVTARDGDFPVGNWDAPVKNLISTETAIKNFLHKYNLPVRHIVFTCGDKKKRYLQLYGVKRHYDDNPEMKMELKNTDIEFIFVQDDRIVQRIQNTKN